MEREERIAALERTVGFAFPADYRTFLSKHVSEEDIDRPLLVVSSNPDYWAVHEFLEIGDGAAFRQIDETYRIVGDVMPDGMLPFAVDIGENFFLIDCRPGPESGAVFWWDHEQDLGEDRVEKVADSFSGFLEDLAPETD